MIEATYVLTLDDLMEAGKEGTSDDRSIIRFRVQWLVVGIGLIAIVFTQKPSPLYWLLLIGLFFIWMAIAYPGRHFKRHFEKSVTNEQVVAHIDQSGITTESPTSRCEMKWAGFRFMLETHTTITLVTISNTIVVFPKRAFAEQSCEEFHRLVIQNGISAKPR
jgi:YcxB-like protein